MYDYNGNICIYDFDGTIYDGDTCRDIVMYGLKTHPFITMKSLIKAKKLQKEYEAGFASFESVKTAMLSFIFKIPNYPKFINTFVSKHMKKIKPFYNSRKTVNDVIVSASYDLWVSVFARRLGVKCVIATKTDSDGNIVGSNCKGAEKMRRLKEMLPNATIASAYTDSEVDIPMLEMAKIGYVVEGNRIVTYKRGYKFKNRK
jgi:HAD superfamily phosphoserine phosphatase-like hydrolase